MYQFSYVKIFSTNHNGNLLLLDDPGRVRSQITSVVCQIQRFDFDCNLVVTRKLIIRILIYPHLYVLKKPLKKRGWEKILVGSSQLEKRASFDGFSLDLIEVMLLNPLNAL